MKPIKILHLYPDRMNIYGDFGNIIALTKRMEWRNISFEYHTSSVGDKLQSDYDLIFMGGGQDKGQVAVAKDLQSKSSVLHDHLMRDVPILTICGAYQLFGKYFITVEDEEIPGIGLFNVVTKATEYRMIGNIVISSDIFGEMVGFENHSGETELLSGATPLGKVIKGYGNTKTSDYEGVIEKNAIGTYFHGSFLPKNPSVADYLIEKAIQLKAPNYTLDSLDDWLESESSNISKER